MKNPESTGGGEHEGILTNMRNRLNRPWKSVILGSIMLFSAAIRSTLAEGNNNHHGEPRTEMTSKERDHTFSKIQEIEITGFSVPGKGTIEIIEKNDGNLFVTFVGRQDGDDNYNFFNMELIDQGDDTFALGKITLHEEFNDPYLDEGDLTELRSGQRVLSVRDTEDVEQRGWRIINVDTGEIYRESQSSSNTSQYLGDNELVLSGGNFPIGFKVDDPDPLFPIDIDHNNADEITESTHIYEINGEKYMAVSATYGGNWGDLDLYEVRYNESEDRWEDMTLIYASVDDDYSMAISQTETGELGQYALHYQEEAFNPWPGKFILSRLEITPTDEDSDGVPAETDCDDSNPDIVDAQDGTCDGDSDGHIDNTAMTNGGGDCDDEDPNVNPDADEVCTDSIDNDCDGATDYDDTECIHPDDIDDDGDGWTENQGDCDDEDPTTYTGAPEYCDTTDHDCDGHPTNGAVDASAWYRDQDGDDHGDPNNLQEACEQPSGYVADDTDCNDEDPNVNPGAAELCTDGVDNNCDGLTDTQDAGACGDYIDDDGDGWTENEGDCNDGSGSIYPGAPEVCGDGVDQDCSGADLSCADIDNDGDGWTENEGDCDDGSISIYPGAPEVCGDGVDQDCSGADLSCADVDNDGDGWTENQGDCDDENAAINPDATEIDGNAVDENCDNDLGLPAEEAGGTAVWVVDGLTFEIDPETGNVTFPEDEGEAVVNTDGTIELQWTQGKGILSGVSGFAAGESAGATSGFNNGTSTTASFTWEGMNLTYKNVGATPAEFIFLPTKPECD